MTYTYDQLKDALAARMREATRREPEGESAILASEQYDRFVAHGFIPDEITEEIGEFLVL